MYNLEDVFSIKSFDMLFASSLTLVTFNNGEQYCSHCLLSEQPVDVFTEEELEAYSKSS